MNWQARVSVRFALNLGKNRFSWPFVYLLSFPCSQHLQNLAGNPLICPKLHEIKIERSKLCCHREQRHTQKFQPALIMSLEEDNMFTVLKFVSPFPVYNKQLKKSFFALLGNRCTCMSFVLFRGLVFELSSRFPLFLRSANQAENLDKGMLIICDLLFGGSTGSRDNGIQKYEMFIAGPYLHKTSVDLCLCTNLKILK